MKLTAMAAAWLVGMALAYSLYDAGPTPVLLLVAIAFLAAAICRLVRVASWPALLVAVCLLGMWRFEVAQPGPPPLLAESGRSATVTGQIVSDPEATSTRIKFTLQVSRFVNPASHTGIDSEVTGYQLLVYAHPPADLVGKRTMPYFRHGDRVEVVGSLQIPEPIENFDYPAYLESQGIFGVFWAQEAAVLEEDTLGWGGRVRQPIYSLRRAMARGLDNALPPQEAALAQALLLGLRGQLPDPVVEDFRQSGTSHLLAISGLHLGILLLIAVGMLQATLGRQSWLPLLLALVVVWLYVLLSGAPASVVRAAIMGSVYLAALGLGRPRESLAPALALSALVMTALNPLAASQISFQLSFAAMTGIALCLPWQGALSQATARMVGNTGWYGSSVMGVAAGWLVSGVVVSVAATLATLPLVALNFGRLPLLGVPATIAATPLLPFALVGGLISATAGMVSPVVGQVAGQVVGLPASLPIAALIALVGWVPKWALEFEAHGPGLSWAWYGLLLAALVLSETRFYRFHVLGRLNELVAAGGPPAAYASARTQVGRYLWPVSVGLILAGAIAYLAVGQAVAGDGKLHVHFLDVGQGDAIFITTPNGKQALIDGGPEFGGAAQALSERMLPWDRSLDLVIVTHLDSDHSRGLLRVLEQYRVGNVVAGVPDRDSYLYAQWMEAVTGGNHRLTHLSAGMEFSLGEGLLVRVLHPPAAPLRGPAWDSNNNSLVLQLQYGEMSFLLTGDIEAEAERYLVRNTEGLASDVLKAGHHGSNSSSSNIFIRNVNPRWAVISAGLDNQYGHPHPDVMHRLGAVVGQENIFSTATHGSIHFSTDGERLWVSTER